MTARNKRTSSTVCTVCRHPDRPRIELTRLAGASLDSIAAKFGIGRDAVWRHMRDHVTEDERALYLADVPVKEMAERAAAESLSLLDYLGLVRSTLVQQMIAAASVNDRHATAALSGRVVDVLREIGKLTGELQRFAPATSVTNNTLILNSPVFTQLEAMLLDRLGAFPEALRAVVDGLHELELEAGAPARTTPVLSARAEQGAAHAA